MEKGRKQLLEKNFKEAIVILAKIVETNSTSSANIVIEAKFYLGISFLDSNQPLLAIKEFS